VHEEDSNSLNDNLNDFNNEPLDKALTVLAIEDLKRATREKRKIYLSDGSFFYLLKNIVNQFSLYEGQTLTVRELLVLRDQSELIEIKQKCFDLLATMSHSRAGLRLKLVRRGFRASLIDVTLEHLTGLGYIDDEAYAKEWLQFRLKKHPEGKMALLAGLQKKGIERSLAERCVNELVKTETEYDALKKIMARLNRQNEPDEKKLISRLLSRGFSYDIIKKALKERDKDANND
jgi:regulatory protein